jgi:NAD(P)-dependent dehydrogenase (short-subunit alcohol dehydrogenase family)
VSVCDGRIVIVTGAGNGLGRAHALAFAAEGARVVVNDIGTSHEGEGSSAGPAQQVVDEIKAAGGEAVANTDDVADWDGAGRLVQTAIDAFGGLDVLVNNAGFLRDRMLANMSVEEWDAVIRVHLRGHFCTMRRAAGLWREQAKAGNPVDARVINTSSGAGLMGSVGQGNYSAAKAGIVGLTLVAAAEMSRYGVTVNAIAPAAATHHGEAGKQSEGYLIFIENCPMGRQGDPELDIAPLAWFLCSDACRYLTGHTFMADGGAFMWA